MGAREELRKGWCPTARRPLETGDGWLVRLRVKHGALTSSAARAIAGLSLRHGNGAIDLSARGNLQIRGATAESYPHLLSALGELGLAESEGFPVLVNPLAGIDPVCDERAQPIAAALETAFADDPIGARLPPKFSTLVDGGGALPLDDIDADVRIELKRFPSATIDEIVSWALAEARKFAARWEGEPNSARVVSERAGPRRIAAAGAVGMIPLGAALAAGIGVPFGRMEHDQLTALASIAERFGIGAIRLGPWRAVFIPGVSESASAKLMAAAAGAGFITDPYDPRRAIQACPGAPACSAGLGATRELALAIANAIPDLAHSGRSLHISGCAKGCACPKEADATVTATGGAYDLAFQARAGERPTFVALEPADVVRAVAAWHSGE